MTDRRSYPLHKVYGWPEMHLGLLERPEGLEPPTRCLEGSCSIHLSYGRAQRPSLSVGLFGPAALRAGDSSEPQSNSTRGEDQNDPDRISSGHTGERHRRHVRQLIGMVHPNRFLRRLRLLRCLDGGAGCRRLEDRRTGWGRRRRRRPVVLDDYRDDASAQDHDDHRRQELMEALQIPPPRITTV